MDRGLGFGGWGSGVQDGTSENIYLETSLRHRWQASKHHVLGQPRPSAGYYRGLIIIRIGFVGPIILFTIIIIRNPQNSLCTIIIIWNFPK